MEYGYAIVALIVVAVAIAINVESSHNDLSLISPFALVKYSGFYVDLDVTLTSLETYVRVES